MRIFCDPCCKKACEAAPFDLGGRLVSIVLSSILVFTGPHCLQSEDKYNFDGYNFVKFRFCWLFHDYFVAPSSLNPKP